METTQLPPADFDRFLAAARKGEWHKGLVDYGFTKPIIDSTGKRVIPVDIGKREFAPVYSTVFRRYIGVWDQVELLARMYNRVNTGSLASAHFTFCAMASWGSKPIPIQYEKES